MSFTHDYIICDCLDPKHVLVLEKHDDNTRYVTVQMSPYLNFWGRVKNAMKYIFLPVNLVGWDTFVVNDKAKNEINNWLKDNQ